MDGDESLRRAIAEMLAAIPEGGHELLRELSKSDDMMVRRAVVFGLSRVHAPWALALLYRALLEDSQWYVRSAAEQAFHSAERSEGSGPTAHPNPDGLPWMVDWAASKGDSVPVGESGRQLLIRALQEGDPLRRAAAALTIAYLGYVPGLKPLYAALRDQDENVRGTAYESLVALQLRLGQLLPAI
jgi:HEAT repeat protein